MADLLKKALVESYVGVVAIGWMIADAAVRIASALQAPILTGFRQHLASEMVGLKPTREPIEWQLVYPDLISAAILLAFSYGLLRWLYYAKPVAAEPGVEAKADPAIEAPSESADSASA